ncbi:carboxylesterase [Citromicrobium sp. RCC1885]|uniref:alpha/beta hydrolase n=1 Tax=unclassified Citromicrobium TaxID=2630544 RepID=UPI0006C91ADD|nr:MULTISPECIES: alpha/beta hydrolase [unclassified Citromicrobium]KPM21735.1 carboxylesterase [Citromicrobium sp. RCC1885]KPM23635.1 carboxylesterase [Citromicrobium sp. RCC1878]MAO03126.1 alpha/beta hydrolase [Citromicrobium sp.]OAM06849.1 carboxylesterase [Citromicrobium sp. RCC1897]|tara:strand:+ start:1787 stop:2857 length:1071 start_codon:yes stop_codon:yes gene_type:complete
MEKKPKEPGGCCLVQMIFVLALTILAYNLYHGVWPDLRHHLLDKADLAFTFRNDAEVRGPIAYGRHEDQVLTITRSEAARSDAALPVLVFFHGGSWANGSPEAYGFIGRNFAPRGFVVVNAGYRLVPEGRYPAMLADSAAAVKWTVQNIARYGGDPDQIYLMGHSAGAYNAVMLGIDRRWTRRLGLPEDTIDGVIGLAGPYDFLPLEGEGMKNAFGEAKPLAATQPIRFARKDAPPMLLITGADDEQVSPDNVRKLYDALAAKGAPVRRVVLDDIGHITLVMGLAKPFDYDRRVKDEVSRFLRKQIRDAARERVRSERRAREMAATRDADSPPAREVRDPAPPAAQASGDIQPAGG